MSDTPQLVCHDCKVRISLHDTHNNDHDVARSLASSAAELGALARLALPLFAKLHASASRLSPWLDLINSCNDNSPAPLDFFATHGDHRVEGVSEYDHRDYKS